jgi:hypothetical protein
MARNPGHFLVAWLRDRLAPAVAERRAARSSEGPAGPGGGSLAEQPEKP